MLKDGTNLIRNPVCSDEGNKPAPMTSCGCEAVNIKWAKYEDSCSLKRSSQCARSSLFSGLIFVNPDSLSQFSSFNGLEVKFKWA